MVEVAIPEGRPRQVGPYRIVRRIGVGGMGTVFEGRSPSGRAVAVKVVRRELAADEEFRKRFQREVTAAKAVSGAFTAAVVDADPEGDPPWLATVYVPGPSLMQLIGSDGPMSERRVRLLGAGLVEALQAIHAAGVVHRDLKPPNVLLAEDGPRVIDFGISVISGSSSLTQVGIAMGTPEFMSPEQMTDDPVEAPSDIFALGAVLAFAATGTGPFGTGSAPSMMHRIVNEQPRLEALPRGLRALIGRCLAKRPEERPALDELLALLLEPAPEPGEEDEEEGEREEDAAVTPAAAPEAVPEPEPDPEPEPGPKPVPTGYPPAAQALLNAGLTDRMVIEAVTRGRS